MLHTPYCGLLYLHIFTCAVVLVTYHVYANMAMLCNLPFIGCQIVRHHNRNKIKNSDEYGCFLISTQMKLGGIFVLPCPSVCLSICLSNSHLDMILSTHVLGNGCIDRCQIQIIDLIFNSFHLLLLCIHCIHFNLEYLKY